MEKLRRYVESGSFERDAEQGFNWLGWLSWAAIFAAILVFWPVAWHVFGR